MARSRTAEMLTREASRAGRGLVLIVLLAVALYYVATHARELVGKMSRPALEGLARAIGVPDDVIAGASDAVLRELVAGWVGDKAKSAAWWTTVAAVLYGAWRLRGIAMVAAAGGVPEILFVAGAVAAGWWAVSKVGVWSGKLPSGLGWPGGHMPGDGCVWDGSQWSCSLPGTPLGWNEGGSIYV